MFGGVLGVPLGVFVLHNVDPAAFQARDRNVPDALRRLWAAGAGDRASRRRKGLDAVIGLVGGVLGGLGGMSGSVPAIWTQLRGWKRDLRRATMQVYNIAMHVFTLTIYWRPERSTRGAAPVRVVAPAMLIPAYFGARLYRGFQREDVYAYHPGAAAVLGGGDALWLGADAVAD